MGFTSFSIFGIWDIVEAVKELFESDDISILPNYQTGNKEVNRKYRKEVIRIHQ